VLRLRQQCVEAELTAMTTRHCGRSRVADASLRPPPADPSELSIADAICYVEAAAPHGAPRRRCPCGGLVDASTTEGQVDEGDDWCGAVAAMLTVNLTGVRGVARSRRLDSLDEPRTRAAPLRIGTEWRYARLHRPDRAPLSPAPLTYPRRGWRLLHGTPRAAQRSAASRAAGMVSAQTVHTPYGRVRRWFSS
jgi:hypothetical protein